MIRRIVQRIRRMGGGRAVILLYHQVCDRKSDPWQLAVSPEKFELQLRMLRKEFNVISMSELVHGLLRRRLPKNAVAITFDDGFADNYSHAAPLLEWYQLPAAFFLTTGAIHLPQYYWWDVLQALMLNARHLPLTLEVAAGEFTFKHKFRSAHVISSRQVYKIQKWCYGMPISNERIDLFLRLWELIKPLGVLDRERVMKQLRTWAGVERVVCADATPLQDYQALSLGGNTLFQLGAHTVNHVMLGTANEQVQHFEISKSKDEVESLVQGSIDGFAYPYGNYTHVTRRLVADLSFDYAVSTASCAVDCNADRYALPRMQVKNWSAEQLGFNIRQLMNA